MPQSSSRPFQRALVKLYQIHTIWWPQRCPSLCSGSFGFKQLLTFRFLQILLYLEKNYQVILFRSLTQVSENAPKITSIGPPITQKRPFKKLKIWFFLAPFISKIKTVSIFDFLSVRYFSKGLLSLKNWHIRVNYR